MDGFESIDCRGLCPKNVLSLQVIHFDFEDDFIDNHDQCFRNVKDIDLFVGGLAEKPMNGSILGPTFSCLIGIQVYHWKWGDRFYFEHGGQSGSFTLGIKHKLNDTNSYCFVFYLKIS